MKKRTRMVANTIVLAENRVVSYIQAKLDAGYIGILKTKDGKKATGLSDYKAGANLLQRMAKDGMLIKVKFGEYMLGSVPPRPLPSITNKPTAHPVINTLDEMECIVFLKGLGYKILKPKTEYSEV
jgi:hypothetical protein